MKTSRIWASRSDLALSLSSASLLFFAHLLLSLFTCLFIILFFDLPHSNFFLSDFPLRIYPLFSPAHASLFSLPFPRIPSPFLTHIFVFSPSLPPPQPRPSSSSSTNTPSTDVAFCFFFPPSSLCSPLLHLKKTNRIVCRRRHMSHRHTIRERDVRLHDPHPPPPPAVLVHQQPPPPAQQSQQAVPLGAPPPPSSQMSVHLNGAVSTTPLPNGHPVPGAPPPPPSHHQHAIHPLPPHAGGLPHHPSMPPPQPHTLSPVVTPAGVPPPGSGVPQQQQVQVLPLNGPASLPHSHINGNMGSGPGPTVTSAHPTLNKLTKANEETWLLIGEYFLFLP